MGLEIRYLQTAVLKPYAQNSRTHSNRQVEEIAASIREFGFTNPVLIDDEQTIIAGHGRVLAAEMLGMETVPTILLSGLTSAQKKAYVIADNKLALNAGWDEELLKSELELLQASGIDLDLIGFTEDELAELFDESISEAEEKDSQYTKKITTPIYEIKGAKPSLDKLFCNKKALTLEAEIESSNLSIEIKNFLKLAAQRHVVFNYENIAEFYAHADNELKMLMEKSALVIIDYNAAIENGYVKLSEDLMRLSSE